MSNLPDPAPMLEALRRIADTPFVLAADVRYLAKTCAVLLEVVDGLSRAQERAVVVLDTMTDCQ